MKKFFKILILIFMFLFLLLFLLPHRLLASSLFDSIDINQLDLTSIRPDKVQSLKDKIENLNIDKNTLQEQASQGMTEEIVQAYEELSSVVSNEEIADFIEDNKEVLSSSGVSQGMLSSTSTLLKTFEPETVIDIIQNDINLDEILEDSESSSTTAIAISAIKNTSTLTKLKVAAKLLLSNGHIRLFLAFMVLVMIYSIFISGILFKKASKPPLRNNHSYLQGCDLFQII